MRRHALPGSELVMSFLAHRRLSRRTSLGAALVLVVGLSAVTHVGASAAPVVLRSIVHGTDGKPYWVTNHLVTSFAPAKAAAAGAKSTGHHEYLLVWAGDANVADTKGSDIQNTHLGVNPVKLTNEDAVDDPPAPDFLAVIDADKGSPTYGKVVNTATVGPLVENEPHHMQYVWHKGDTIYAGALFAAATYAFDVSALPQLKLKGVSLPTNTLGGSVPDAYWVLKDGTAYGTYMGGPVVPGPHTYADGSTQVGNGFAGSPGEVVHFGQNAQVLSESPAATPQGDNQKLC